MAGKTVSFNTHCNLSESQLESVARWLSCNGEIWGMGPTVVFASAAALFLYNELQATIYVDGDHAHVSLLEKTLVSSMVVGMLALMIHLWVCSMRFFQYYLDTLIRDSPNILLEMTTAGFLGQTELVPLGPLTRFLKQQQPQIHITICWFLSLCYADYVRKHYCQRFNMPYLEQWQTELHARASRGVHQTIQKVNSFVGAVHQRLRGYTQAQGHGPDTPTVRSGAAAAPAAACRSRAAAPRASCRAPATPPPTCWSTCAPTCRRLDVRARARRRAAPPPPPAPPAPAAPPARRPPPRTPCDTTPKAWTRLLDRDITLYPPPPICF